MLVDIVRPISLSELVGAELYLEELLGVKVDIVPTRAVGEELRDSILAEAVPGGTRMYHGKRWRGCVIRSYTSTLG